MTLGRCVRCRKPSDEAICAHCYRKEQVRPVRTRKTVRRVRFVKKAGSNTWKRR